MKTKSLLMAITILAIAVNMAAQETGTYTDSRDNKTYKTVKIGTQTWIAENLAYKATSGCYSYENNESNSKIYGYLYNWGTAEKVCPAGWHLPSKNDWSVLLTCLGGELIAGDKLKEAGTNHWQKPISAATNESAFSAIPGGYRNEKGEFYVLGYNCWWQVLLLVSFCRRLRIYLRQLNKHLLMIKIFILLSNSNLYEYKNNFFWVPYFFDLHQFWTKQGV